MKLRRAGLADAASIAHLAGQLGYDTSPEEARWRLATILETQDQAVIVAESRTASLVGWVHILGSPRLITDPYVEIGGLVVDRAHRGCGLGRALREAAETWARGEGYGLVRLRSNTTRSRAHDFYEHIGYRLTTTQYAFAKEVGGSGQEELIAVSSLRTEDE